MAEPTPPTETRVGPPGREISGVVARTPARGGEGVGSSNKQNNPVLTRQKI